MEITLRLRCVLLCQFVFFYFRITLQMILLQNSFSWPWNYVSCCTFILGMEIMLQLRFVFVCHCEVFFITSQLRYLFVPCRYVFL